jgi:hypothetical protein
MAGSRIGAIGPIAGRAEFPHNPSSSTDPFRCGKVS